eukprot:TRINITY_DN8317_c0_g1_i2.p1 TRINITY_DN8317_c0_g1~~TRINITY_DN8317_c0_g1_i2.p1  ORF type:complete len:521 (+),score=122.40 TRINITY_DN8317_c0_g1_i2:55-1617(+)
MEHYDVSPASPHSEEPYVYITRIPADALERLTKYPDLISIKFGDENTLTIDDASFAFSCNEEKTNDCYVEDSSLRSSTVQGAWTMYGAIKERLIFNSVLDANLREKIRLETSKAEEKQFTPKIKVVDDKKGSKKVAGGRTVNKGDANVPHGSNANGAGRRSADKPSLKDMKPKPKTTLPQKIGPAQERPLPPPIPANVVTSISGGSTSVSSAPALIQQPNSSPPHLSEKPQYSSLIPGMPMEDHHPHAQHHSSSAPNSPEHVTVERVMKVAPSETVRKRLIQMLAPGALSTHKLEVAFPNVDITSLLTELATSKRGSSWELKKEAYKQVDVEWQDYTDSQKKKVADLLRKIEASAAVNGLKPKASSAPVSLPPAKPKVVEVVELPLPEQEPANDERDDKNKRKTAPPDRHSKKTRVHSSPKHKVSDSKADKEDKTEGNLQQQFKVKYEEYLSVRRDIEILQTKFKTLGDQWKLESDPLRKQDLNLLISQEYERSTRKVQQLHDRHNTLQKELTILKRSQK